MAFDGEPGADHAMGVAWRAARWAGLAAVISGGLGSVRYCLGLLTFSAQPLAGGRSAWEVLGTAILFALASSLVIQFGVGVRLLSRDRRARRWVVRRLVWCGAAGIVPALAGLYLLLGLWFLVSSGLLAGRGRPDDFFAVALTGGIGIVLLSAGVAPWWVLLRHRAWLRQLAAS